MQKLPAKNIIQLPDADFCPTFAVYFTKTKFKGIK
jgi:hypothetical protein